MFQRTFLNLTHAHCAIGNHSTDTTFDIRLTIKQYLCCNRQGVSRAARRKSIVNDQSNSSNNNISNPLGSPNSASRQSDPFAASQRCGCRWTTKIVGEYAEPMSKDGQPHSGQAVWFYSAVQGERMTVHNHETNERELARYGLLSEARREVDGGRGSSVAGGLSEAALETAYRPAEEYMTLPLRQSIHYEQQQQRSDAASMYQQHHQSEETLMFQQRHRAPSFTSSQQSSSDYTMHPTVTSYTSLNVNAPNDRPTAQPFVQPHHSMYRALNTMSTLPLYERPFSIYANGQQQLYAQLPPPIRMPPFEQPPENSHDRNGSERTTTTTTTSLAMRRDPRVASALPAGWRMPLPTVDIREVLRR